MNESKFIMEKKISIHRKMNRTYYKSLSDIVDAETNFYVNSLYFNWCKRKYYALFIILQSDLIELVDETHFCKEFGMKSRATKEK